MAAVRRSDAMSIRSLPLPATTRACVLAIAIACVTGVASVFFACSAENGNRELTENTERTAISASDRGTRAHLDRVMTSASCAGCHAAIYAEHQNSAHGRAFLDKETRIATRDFHREDCVRCHTPRPIFETGIGMTPMQRWTHLEDGNDCM